MRQRPLLSLLAVVILTANAVPPAHARDDRLNLPVSEFFQRADVQERLGNEVEFHFGDGNHPAVAERFGEFQSNKKTNAFNKTDKEACEWALLSAMLEFKERALSLGGDAVINMTSNYKSVPFDSESEYQCGAGAIIAGVTIKGEVVKLR